MTDKSIDTMFWRGRPVINLEREDLLKIIEWQQHRLDEFQSPESISRQAAERVRALRRG